jgi:hypothetical protein
LHYKRWQQNTPVICKGSFTPPGDIQEVSGFFVEFCRLSCDYNDALFVLLFSRALVSKVNSLMSKVIARVVKQENLTSVVSVLMQEKALQLFWYWSLFLSFMKQNSLTHCCVFYR